MNKKSLFITALFCVVCAFSVFAEIPKSLDYEYDIVTSPAIDYNELKTTMANHTWCDLMSTDDDSKIIVYNFQNIKGLSAVHCTVTIQILDDKITFTAKKFSIGMSGEGGLLKTGVSKDEKLFERLKTALDTDIENIMNNL